jgi:hypothetical protein
VLEYIYNCLKETYDNLGNYKERLLARGTLEIPSLFKPLLERARRTLKLKLFVEDVILNNTILLRLRVILDDFVYSLVGELKSKAGSIRAYSLRVIVG